MGEAGVRGELEERMQSSHSPIILEKPEYARLKPDEPGNMVPMKIPECGVHALTQHCFCKPPGLFSLQLVRLEMSIDNSSPSEAKPEH